MNNDLKKNTIANYIGKIYTSIIAFVVYPLYLQYLGAEAFGLVGFFVVLHGWLQLLDIGMTPTLSRQVAYVRGRQNGFHELKNLLRSLETIFFLLGLLIIIPIFFSKNWIAYSWLNVTELDKDEVAFCIMLMGVMVSFSWFSTLYKGGIEGMEKQVWLNIIIIIINSLKFFGVLAIFQWISTSPSVFFIYQLIIYIIQLIVLKFKFYSFIPKTEKYSLFFSYETLKPFMPFALSIAYTSGIWILITQLDKLLLSNILSLKEYGYFSLIAIILNGLIQISNPISRALLPRMIFLLSQKKENEMLILYRKASQVMAIIVFPVAFIIASFSAETLFVWTGDMAAAIWGSNILRWYIMGNGVLSILAFQFYLQFAYGKLKLHVQMNTILIIIIIPAMFIAAYNYGPMGTAITWFLIQIISFIIWPAIIHKKFAPGLHKKWLTGDILPVFLFSLVPVIIFKQFFLKLLSKQRIEIFFYLCIITILVFLITGAGSREVRKLFMNKIKKWRYHE